ncbi:MAG: DUF1385 domain-containing protein [Tissierellia bacterium]|nr:DUF1385 domain-containing protein [Tissierellia bacterium]
MKEDTWGLETKNKKETIKSLLINIIYLLVGGAIGFILPAYYGAFMGPYIKNGNIFIFLLGIIGMFLILFIGYLVHIIIHETGHLIFGLLSGYSFISFRIGPYIIVREKGNLILKKYNLPGTAGQCLMVPPDIENGKYPFLLYNCGGVILNLLVAIPAIIVGRNVNFPLNAILIGSGMVGLFIVVTNGIPLIIGGVPNDAHNVFSIIKDEEAKRSFFIQLKTHALQSQGVRIKDMALDTFKLKEDSNLANPLNTAQRLLEYTWYLDNMDLENAKKCIDSFKPYFNKIATLFKYEINCERMFLELVGNCDRDLIDRLYDKNLKKYIKTARFMISKKRLLMAYEGFYNNSKEKALEYYEELKDLASKYPIKGEAAMELMLVDWISEKL